MTAKKDRRTGRIIDLLAEKKRIEVKELAELMGVSQVTIRKDLDELESKEFIRRVHGYAVLNSTDNIGGRLAYHYDQKRKIAEKAAELIKDGDTLMIESGSCCALLASVLSQTKKNLTIITNSAFIADYIKESDTQIVLLGGIYQSSSQCLIGPMIRDAAANYNVNYFFIGTDGWSERTGFTNKDAMRAQAVRDMAHSAECVAVLTESEKFEAPGTTPINMRRQPKLVITDNRISAETIEILKEHEVTVVISSETDE